MKSSKGPRTKAATGRMEMQILSEDVAPNISEDQFIPDAFPGDGRHQIEASPRARLQKPGRNQIAAVGLATISNLWRNESTVKIDPYGEGIEALSRLIVLELKRDDCWKGEADIEASEPRTFDIRPLGIAKIADEVAKETLRCSSFLYLFLSLTNSLRKPPYPDLTCLAKEHIAGGGPLHYWEEWLERALSVDRESLGVLRDWVDCYGTASQTMTFTTRAWQPVQAFMDTVGARIRDREPWHEAKRWFKGLNETSHYLSMLSKSIYSQQGEQFFTRTPAHYPPDEWDTPLRLRRLAKMLREDYAGKRVRTSQIKRDSALAGNPLDPGQLLSPKRGASSDDLVWARKYLKDGRGWWRWQGPKG